MQFGCFFVGQRPLRHEQYGDNQQANPNPVRRTDAEVYHDIMKGARLAEDLGFDSVWIAEHAFSEHGIISSPHSLLAAIAAQTKRVKLGVACSIVPWYHPLRLAQDLATVDVISEGRLIIGVGRGYQKQEFDAYGLDIAESPGAFCRGHGHCHAGLESGLCGVRREVLSLSGGHDRAQALTTAASADLDGRHP